MRCAAHLHVCRTPPVAPPFIPALGPFHSCWVLGRYAKWLLERADTGQRGELDSVMQGVCARCLDHNRRVQVCVGCGAGGGEWAGGVGAKSRGGAKRRGAWQPDLREGKLRLLRLRPTPTCTTWGVCSAGGGLRLAGYFPGRGRAGAAHGAIHGCGAADARHRAAGGGHKGCARAVAWFKQPLSSSVDLLEGTPSLQRYGRKATRNAYDTISTAAEEAPRLLSQPALAQVLCAVGRLALAQLRRYACGSCRQF